MLPVEPSLSGNSVKVRSLETRTAIMACDRPMTSKDKSDLAWQRLERHFARHKELVERFREADASAVRRMWRTQTNEAGVPLSAEERQALQERHCELFGSWPRN
jgi:hypothetical protein